MAKPTSVEDISGKYIKNTLRHLQSTLLQKDVYPYLNSALKDLVTQLLENSDVQHYQEKLKEQKIIDTNEKRRIDRELLKEELGDDYVSSESSLDFQDDDSDDVGVKKTLEQGEGQENEDEGENIPSESISDNLLGSEMDSEEGEKKQESGAESDLDSGSGQNKLKGEGGNGKKDAKKNEPSNREIKENDLQVVEEEDENTKRGHKKKEPFWYLGENPFNPILSLGHK